MSSLTPLAHLRISLHQIPAFALIPNTSLHSQPLMIYHSLFPPSTSPSRIEAHLQYIGVVEAQWRYSMYPTTHFHSTTHEVLVIFSGAAVLCFGGEENVGRLEVEVRKGDGIVVPAGVGHRLLRETGEEPFAMVGSYPKGKEWDMCYGRKGEESRVEGIKGLAWLSGDPFYGDENKDWQ